MTIPSAKMQEDREVTIVLPASYEKDTNKRYPLLVLLDGDYLLNPFQGVIDYGVYWDEIPETIIVAIHQNKKGVKQKGFLHGKIRFWDFMIQITCFLTKK